MNDFPARDFYDQLADDYHLLFPDWDASMASFDVVLSADNSFAHLLTVLTARAR